MPSTNNGIWLGGMGSEIHGEPFTAQIEIVDPVNDFLYDKYLREYIQWQRVNGSFHDSFEADYARVQRSYYARWFYAGAAALFAAAVINPNFTKRRSWYVRKFSVGFCGVIGFQFGQKNLSDNQTMLLMRMHDYLPLEVKQTLASKDYRYMALFNYKKPERQLFDEKTGKSLS